MRLFIALELPPPAIEEIATFINDMPTMAGGNVRWIRRENVHLTLLFLGDTPTEKIPAVKEQLTKAASNTASFTLRLGETGAFPSYRSPKILWIGLDGDVKRLMQLQGRIEGAMRSIDFTPEKRQFTPHITVGRAERDLEQQYAGDVGFSWRRSVLPTERAEIPVTGMHLLRSQFQDGHAVYSKLYEAELGG
jgi:2'-5' RNA ligase